MRLWTWAQVALMAVLAIRGGYASADPAPESVDVVEQERQLARSVMELMTPQFAEAARALANGERTDFEALDQAFAAFQERWPEAEAAWDLTTPYLRFALESEAGLNERQLLEHLLQARNRHVRAFARARLDEENLATAPFELRFRALDGRPVDLAELRGRVVLFDFWASWCQPCLEELPFIKSLAAKYEEAGLSIIGISLDQEGARSQFTRLVAEHGVTWPQHFSGQGWRDDLARTFTITAIPDTRLFDQQGLLVKAGLRGEALEQEIRRLLNL